MSKKTKRLILVGAALLAVLLCAFLLLRSGKTDKVTQEELIRNGQFTELDSEDMPVSWYTDAYVYQGYTDYDIQDGAAHIVNRYPNDARFVQEVTVSPGSFYCLKGFIKASAEGGIGANLSVADVFSFSDCVYDTNGEWQEVTLYGQTGESQTHLTVFVRLGGYGGESEGEAWFRDISLRKIDAIPEGAFCLPLYAQAAPVQEPAEPSQIAGGWTLALCCALYTAAFVLLLIFLRRRKPLPSIRGVRDSSTIYLLLILLLGLGLRLLIALMVPGYDVDIGCFTAWADQLAARGPMQFYSEGFCDYPPGYLMILWPLGLLGRLWGGATELMVKLPSVLSDLILCVLLYREGRKRSDARTALAAVMFYALNPLILCTSAAWGQSDSAMTLLLLITVLCAMRGSWKTALPVYVLSVLVKPQALMSGPLGLAALVMHACRAWKQREKRKALLTDTGIGLALSLLIVLIAELLFQGEQRFGWLLRLYANTMGEYAYATVNACNLHFLLGRNWGVMDGRVPSLLLTLGTWALCAVPTLLVYKDQFLDAFRTKSGKKPPVSRQTRIGFLLTVILSVLLLLVPVTCAMAGCYTYQVLTWAAISYGIAITAVHLLLSGSMENLPLLGAGMLMAIFACGSMMHERYLFPVAALLLISYFIKKDKRILYLALAVTLAGFLNVGCVLDRNIRVGGSSGHLNAPEYGIQSDLAFLEYLSAAITCLSAFGTLYLSLYLSRPDAVPLPVGQEGQNRNRYATNIAEWPLPVDEPVPRMRKEDWLVMLGCTALYAALALWNLGATTAPQTAFVSADFAEQVVVDLGSERDFRMFYYGGIHDYDQEFTVEISADGENWDDSYALSMLIGDCFKWQRLDAFSQEPQHGRYVRLNASNYRLTLFELVFRDAETGEPIQASLLSDNAANDTAAYLIDEPDSMAGSTPNWYNSMYFDEIYHARTAYEHLHNMRPYETTHPPLGKVLMSVAVSVFGMTPFGWRFAGALAGVLMLPAMYLLGRLLIRRKWGGFAAMMLMTLDCMHYTQTRIATIDSFVVLFIIWSVYFMLCWFRLDLFGKPLWKSLGLLLLSGIFMGLSIASKWTGCYNGVGLAILFFWGLVRRARQIGAARKVPAEKRTAAQRNAVENGRKLLLVTVACCFLFFIFIPLTIYYLSYIPYFRYNGGVTVRKVIEAAVGPYFTDGYVGGMLGYHSQPGLGMDHPYYSPWYEWPVIAKPMWYFSILYRTAAGEMSIMAMGNPAVWWVGLAGVLGTLYYLVRRHIHTVGGLSATLVSVWRDDPRYTQLLVCFFAQYLPWMLVPRGTYIYHYFPSVPFIILCALLCLDRIGNHHPKQSRIAVIVLLSLALVCFILLFPYASGFVTPHRWMQLIKDIFPIPLQY